MPIEGFVKAENWNEFNSSLVIEVTRPNGVFTCTGVAISHDLIITAAHCLEGDIKGVRVFTQDRYDPKAPFYEVSSFKIHPNYNSKNSRFISDLAKITLKQRLPDEIKTIPLYKGSSPQGKFYRFGFGERNKRNVRTVITPKFRGINSTLNILELNDMFSYSGDSGGPIFLQEGSGIYLIAIHSTLSFGPEGRFSYNPLLAPYEKWLFEN
jgi:hypothetical protein